MSILDRIDNTLGGLCPCGAAPRPGSAYCGPDCEPTHISRDTDTRQSGRYATPMRWRPDLVTAADDTDLIPIGSERIGYTGPHRAQIYEHASNPAVWHLRLDDGHCYVGCDLPGMGGRQDPITVERVARIHDTWRRLERELGNTRHLEPDDDPWHNWFPQHVFEGIARVPLVPGQLVTMDQLVTTDEVQVSARSMSDQEDAMRRLIASLEWTIGPGRNPTIRDITTT